MLKSPAGTEAVQISHHVSSKLLDGLILSEELVSIRKGTIKDTRGILGMTMPEATQEVYIKYVSWYLGLLATSGLLQGRGSCGSDNSPLKPCWISLGDREWLIAGPRDRPAGFWECFQEDTFSQIR